MDKLTEYIPPFRIKSETKKYVLEMAEKRQRKMNQFLRIAVENLVKDYLSGKWQEHDY